MNEFALIQQYFAANARQRDDVVLGIGDDAAIVTPPVDQQLVISTDTLIAGVHFPLSTRPADIGYKALAVNLSDMAAMGATPAWVCLSISLPTLIPEWCEEFCQGFFSLFEAYNLQLIGGDTNRGPLSVSVQIQGFVSADQAIRRDTACVGDLIFVSNFLGDAGLGLALIQNKIRLDKKISAYHLQHLNRPEPRVKLGLALADIVNAGIDISDGLLADLGHILERSNCGATVNIDQVPLSESLKNSVSQQAAIQYALTAGDDYELCFTVAADKKHRIESIAADLNCKLSCIGQIEEQPGLRLQSHDDSFDVKGYQHFS